MLNFTVIDLKVIVIVFLTVELIAIQIYNI